MLRIKSVSLKGFKTFAQQTEFSFGTGVTAIVGPNGCGKSNVSDAIRWCLGEQSFGLLRSRKTVDVIFSGSDKKARQGMAAVSIILDNEAGDLKIDFSEVEITRRAYRDGDNEYLINGQRVRLQDITQLLGPSGLGKRAYAVIGQGLIDRVLSLKPEERRTLFEEAAGITGYQQKRQAALRRLEATQHNLGRVQDLLAELSPRLSSLKRQAERALERQQVETDLKDLLHVWYGYQWHRALRDMNGARFTVQRGQNDTVVLRDRLNAIRTDLDRVRQRQSELRADQSDLTKSGDARLRRIAEVIRRLAVTEERLNQTVARQIELNGERSQLQARKESAQLRLEALLDELEKARTRHSFCQNAVRNLQSKLADTEKQFLDARRRLRDCQADVRREEDAASKLRSRLDQLVERRHTLEENATRFEAEIQRRDQAASKADLDLTASRTAAAKQEARIQAIQSDITEFSNRIESYQVTLKREEDAGQHQQREVERLQTRLELLHPVRGGSNLYATGVRSVLEASQQGRLDGILGTVASRIQVPPRLEHAIEVALGAALQNLIVASWQDAQGAIEYLKNAGAGRATFLPLNRLRSRSPIPAPPMNGIIGNAAKAVQCESEAAPAIEHLLQRVWIAEDLPAARHALDRHAPNTSNGRLRRGRHGSSVPMPTVVTLAGEIIRPGGAVTGGNNGGRQRRSALAWEREARELPAELAEAESRAHQAVKRIQAIRQKIEEQSNKRSKLENSRQLLLEESQRQRSHLERAELDAARTQQEAAWQQRLLDQTRIELADMESTERKLSLAQEEAEVLLADARLRARKAEEAAQGSPEELLRRLADRRAEAASAHENLNSRQTLIAEQKRALDQLDNQLQSRKKRRNALDAEEERLRASVADVSAEERDLNSAVTAHQRKVTELESELRKFDSKLGRAEADERAGQQLLHQNESELNDARLALQRTEDRLARLRRDIRQDFGLADMEETTGLPYQPPLPLKTLVAQLPIVHDLPAGLTEEVRDTRARVRRLSNVNPDAPREYEEAAARYHFLQSQSEDLEEAASDLQQVIRALDNRMEGDLRRTFDAVAAEFLKFFKLLLQGGTAQLTVTHPDDILNTGIEISARPPGKRTQNLDLLSGGERSLTACALVFAILRVSPTPFCVLDEVDATLDEANVDRLRAAMEELQDQTQFIIITHNRRTLEIANSIYGITMGDDGVSKVISLKLEGDRYRANEGQAPIQAPAVAF